MQDFSGLYSAVQNNVGLFDASQAFGRLFARGKDAVDLLHRMSTNDMQSLETKSGATQTFLTNEKARIIDLLTVIRDEAGETLFITSAGKEETVIQWLDKFTIMEDAKFVRATEEIAQFGLFGPRAGDVIRSFTDIELGKMPLWSVVGIQIADKPCTLFKSGQRIAESGWWIFTHQESAEAVRAVLAAHVEKNDGAIISNDLFEVLRVEAGLPKTPNELNEKHNPLETSLAHTAVSFTKGCYIGQEVIARLDSYDKVQRHMMGVQFSSNIGATGPIVSEDNEIGEVTSVVQSPQFSNPTGLAYIRSAHANPGATITVNAATGPVQASLVKLPFNV
jgi:folate-binding protein YgfZ